LFATSGLYVYQCRHVCLPIGPTLESTRNPSPHYVTLSYQGCLDPIIFMSLPIPLCQFLTLVHSRWRQAMCDELYALQSSYTMFPYLLRNLLVVVDGPLQSKLALMARMIHSKFI